MIKKKRRILTILIIFAIVFSICGFYYFSVIKKPLKVSGDETVRVEKGESFNNLLNELSSKGKLKNTLVIKLYTKLTSASVDILPGEYLLNSEMSLNDIINTLTTGSDYNQVSFTVPEGFTVDDISEKLEKDGICSADSFKNAVKNYPAPDFVKVDNKKRYTLEGYLFPDTYKFKLGSDPNYIIETMLKRFNEVWKEVGDELKVKIEKNDIEKIMTIASMVEKEARADDERPVIASVINNRIKDKMPLQIDATVLYAHGVHLEKVLLSDLEIDSPYNTYKYSGLPIGPIANPGKASIIGALKPKETDYLFYLLETDTHHYFTNNYDDFLKKKDELGY